MEKPETSHSLERGKTLDKQIKELWQDHNLIS